MKAPSVLCLTLLLSLPACAQSDELTGIPDTLEAVPPMQGSDLYQGANDQANKFYSNGSLLSGDELPLEGHGYVKIHRPRRRWFGTFDLVELLKDVSARMQGLYPSRDRIMVGDISQEGGGRISSHASHQNGLDVDVAFLRVDQTEQHPDDTVGFREDFVKNGKLTANFDLPRNWAFAKVLIGTGRVQRLFVNSVVKKAFCHYAKASEELESERSTLKRLRVIAGHTDHFHIRLTCPRNSPNCLPQEDMADETGC